MQNFLLKLLVISLTMFFAATILFYQNYVYVTYLMNAIVIITFVLVMFINREKNYNFNTFIYLYALFIILGVASSFWAVDFGDAAFNGLQLTLILINLVVIYNAFTKLQLQNTFLNGILIGSFINYIILLGLIQVPFETIFPGGGDRAMGTTGNPNVLAIIMLISLLSSFIYIYKKEEISKPFYYYQYFNIILAFYMIILTVSKKGIIFGVLLIGFYFLLSLKSLKGLVRLSYIIFITALLLWYFIDWGELLNKFDHVQNRFAGLTDSLSGEGGTGSSSNIRKQLILNGLDLIQTRPIFGFGLANFRNVSFSGHYAHNNYIEVVANGGIVGGILFYAIYIYIIKRILNMTHADLKYIFLFFILIFLVMDMAVVSYGSKFQMYALLFIVFFAENNSKKNISV